MKVLSEIQDSKLQEAVLVNIDKEIKEKLPEFHRLVETRYKATDLGEEPVLYFVYYRLCNKLKDLRKQMEIG